MSCPAGCGGDPDRAARDLLAEVDRLRAIAYRAADHLAAVGWPKTAEVIRGWIRGEDPR